MASHAKLLRRVVAISKFAWEKRSGRKLTPAECLAKYGSKYQPIPVPLDVGETEEQYEAAFRADAERRTGRPFHEIYSDGDVEKERRERCLFAHRRLKEFNDRQGVWEPPSLETFVDDFEMPPRPGQKKDKPPMVKRVGTEVERPSRKEEERGCDRKKDLYAKRYVDLDEHARNVRGGLFHRIKAMTGEEKEREFGSQIVPIFVPLARGETKDQYEERFVKWIQEKHHLTLEEAANHPNATTERHYRMLFAQANTFGQVAFKRPTVEPKRVRARETDSQRDESPRKRTRTEEEATPVVQAQRKETCKGQEKISSAIACGCRRCLVSAMRMLALRLTAIDTKTRHQEKSRTDGVAGDVVDLTSDSETVTSSGQSHDPILDQLVGAYNTINEQIVMNEKVLDSSAQRLASTPVTDIKETTEVQDEDQEMRQLIQEEMLNRSVALATLIVYMWRKEIFELKEIASDPNATHVVYVQRAAHHKCASLAEAMAAKQKVITDAEAQLQAAVTDTHNGETDKSVLEALRMAAIEEVKVLESQRKRHFTTLVFFDQHVRQLIRVMLRRV